MRWNWMRRAFGVAIAALPFVLIAGSFQHAPRPTPLVALIPLAFAGFLAGLNLHVSFIRPALWMREHGTMDGLPFVSGIPLAGTIIAVLTAMATHGSYVVAAIALLIILCDVGGPQWFVVSTWRDSSFWDE